MWELFLRPTAFPTTGRAAGLDPAVDGPRLTVANLSAGTITN
jgi:hypothetical protein